MRNLHLQTVNNFFEVLYISRTIFCTSGNTLELGTELDVYLKEYIYKLKLHLMSCLYVTGSNSPRRTFYQYI